MKSLFTGRRLRWEGMSKQREDESGWVTLVHGTGPPPFLPLLFIFAAQTLILSLKHSREIDGSQFISG